MCALCVADYERLATFEEARNDYTGRIITLYHEGFTASEVKEIIFRDAPASWSDKYLLSWTERVIEEMA